MKKSAQTVIRQGAYYTIAAINGRVLEVCLLYTSPSPRDSSKSRMPSSA